MNAAEMVFGEWKTLVRKKTKYLEVRTLATLRKWLLKF
jgi:hypothetical protein